MSEDNSDRAARVKALFDEWEREDALMSEEDRAGAAALWHQLVLSMPYDFDPDTVAEAIGWAIGVEPATTG